jgi:hypothetical protein
VRRLQRREGFSDRGALGSRQPRPWSSCGHLKGSGSRPYARRRPNVSTSSDEAPSPVIVAPMRAGCGPERIVAEVRVMHGRLDRRVAKQSADNLKADPAAAPAEAKEWRKS